MPVVEIAEDADAVLLRLPPRNLFWLRLIGGSCIGAAVVFSGIMLAMGFGAPAPGVGPGFMEHFVPCLLVGIGLLLFVISFVTSRTEVRIDDVCLRVTEQFGPFRWFKDCPVESIKRFAIRHLFVTSRREQAPPPKPEDFAVLVIETVGRPPVRFAHGYTREQLLEFAAELSARCAQLGNLKHDPRIEVVEQDEATLFEERDTPPDESAVVCESHTDGVTLVVPPDSFGKIVGQSLLAVLPVFIFLVIRIVLIIAAWPAVNPFDYILLAGGGVALTAIYLHARARGRRQSVLAVVGDKLMVIEAGIFRSKRHEWERSELYDVRSGEPLHGQKSGQIFELQVWKRDGKKIHLLRGRTDAELRWMATVLRRALRLPAKKAELVESPEQAQAV